jgi:hypothetical protein
MDVGIRLGLRQRVMNVVSLLGLGGFMSLCRSSPILSLLL